MNKAVIIIIKLENILCILQDLMVVGFDVHPDKNGLSIGAFVASLDRNMSRYFSAARYHSTGEQLSKELSISICGE